MLQRQLWLVNDNSGPPYTDDKVLVEGLKCGDAHAVEYVVHQHAPALYRFVYYQLRDVSLAEDLVAEVMARMIENIDRFVLGQASFQSWLYRIARNLITDHYRARTRQPQTSLELWLDAEPASEPGQYDTKIESIPDRERLRAGLATLTNEQREVILLHVIEGWELPTIARLLDRSLPSIKGLYYRGIQSLRRALTSRNNKHK